VSIEAMTWALSADVGDSTRKLVLIGYANHAHKDGRNSWASKDTIAEYVNCDPKTVRRHVKALIAAGWLREGDQSQVIHLRADRRPVVYDLAMSDAQRAQWKAEQVPAGENARPDNLSPRESGHGGTSGGTPVGARGDMAMSPEPSRTQEPLPNPSAARGIGCVRHSAGPVANCRGCGTTQRQLEARRQADLDEQRRDDARRALEAEHGRRLTAVPLPADLKAQTRDQIQASKQRRTS
jgi:DNA-binding MarR family transcriptional regulator